ncbi:Mis12-domain-containing protein [Athelia psychrophila]|uniref:Mis12-domain-containing protein n=1 Tax=Athelia psychrophila TaxID=1759441 RepID=A0A166AT23_9AGAM|nr:Mis12-domain-containing protein [Fibularhizoctonia sp. CBS 109695]
MSHPAPTAPSILLPEVLGFSPQLLLDDVINSANSAVTASVDGMEMFLLRWADGRAKEGKGKSEDDITQDIEQGLVAFQTLLESHVDIAFDFFELWSLRNIFAVPADLPVVVPHHQGLDLEAPPEKEAELIAEIDDLRRKIDNQQRLKRLYIRAARKSRLQLKHSQSQLEKIMFLRSPQLQILGALPASLTQMCEEVASLPLPDPASLQQPLPDLAKRPWETSKTGYFQWAVGQSLAHSGGDGAQGASAVSRVAEVVQAVGTADQVKSASQPLKQPEGTTR